MNREIRTPAGHIWIENLSYRPTLYTCRLCNCVKTYDERRGITIYSHPYGLTGGTSEPTCRRTKWTY